MLRALAFAAASCAALILSYPSWGGDAQPVDAGTALRMDVPALVEGAESVFEGRIVAKRALPTARGRVVTELEVDVHRTWLGADAPRRTVRMPGGVLPDGSGVLIAGMPTLLLGEDVILFLTEENASGARMPVGLSQGKLRVATTLAGAKVLVRHHAGLELVHAPGAASVHGPSEEHLEYAATVAEIHAAVEGRRMGRRMGGR